MDKTKFFREDIKYSELWQNGYKPANWKRLANKVIEMTNSSRNNLIDFGFGDGSSIDFFEKKGFKVAGVDVSTHAVNVQKEKGKFVYHSSLDDLNFLLDNWYHIGFCNDVIEHLPEESINKALSEMTRVCSDYLFISVCPTLSHHLSSGGENLHLTVKPKEWWEEQFKQFGNVEPLKFWFTRSLRYVIDLRE